jgi:protein-S-isoprenylcysteine O-methyltransferase Ste14
MPIWLRALLFTVAFPGSVAGLLPYVLARSAWAIPFDIGPARWIGAPLFALGILVYVSTTWHFGTTGRGTPAPWDAPESLVRTGPHAWVRNPMHLGIVACILGNGVLWQAGILFPYAAVVWIAFHHWVVRYEEPTLRRRFGAAYERYAADVHRWWPRPPR